jgi:seryl-tRNA synthetase
MFSLLSNWKLLTIALLLASLAGSAYLLKQSYKDNGEKEAIGNQLRAVNDETARILVAEREQFQDLQQKMIELDKKSKAITANLSKARKQLNEIPDESGCLDVDLGDAFWLRITADSNSATTMPTD